MVEQRRISETNGAGSRPPRDSSNLRRRRLLDSPANDNVPSVGQRILRAAVFVVIGSVLAYLLREILG